VLRKASALPITFRDRSSSGDGGGLDSVGDGVTRVTGHVSGGSGVTGSTGCGAGRCMIGLAGGCVGGKCGGACCATRYLATRPSTPGFDGLARPVVLRMLFLEEWKHALGAVGGPECQ